MAVVAVLDVDQLYLVPVVEQFGVRAFLQETAEQVESVQFPLACLLDVAADFLIDESNQLILDRGIVGLKQCSEHIGNVVDGLQEGLNACLDLCDFFLVFLNLVL